MKEQQKMLSDIEQHSITENDLSNNKRGEKNRNYRKQVNLRRKQQKRKARDAQASAVAQANREEEKQIPVDLGIQCEVCCSDNVEAVNVTMCSKGHIFCKECARRMAEIQLGSRKCHLPCMSMEGCDASFDEGEVRSFLDDATFQLWDRLKAVESIKAAGLADLEQCPYCNFACVIENPQERLFHCENSACRKVSCRNCREEDHLPKSCLEYEMDMRKKDMHKAEEYLSSVLMRRCPQNGCNTPIIKDETSKSCNRVTCAVCLKDMCYCCRKDVSVEGYRHFDMESRGLDEHGRCPLWEDTLERHKRDIEEARASLGKLNVEQTAAEKADEAKRREQRRVNVKNGNINQLALEGLQIEEVNAFLDIPNVEREERKTYDMLSRRREERWNEKQRNDAAEQSRIYLHRLHAIKQQEVRMQILGINPTTAQSTGKSSRWQLGPAIHLQIEHSPPLSMAGIKPKDNIAVVPSRNIRSTMSPAVIVEAPVVAHKVQSESHEISSSTPKAPRHRRKKGALRRAAEKRIVCQQ